jgi:hypothetical protein
MLIHRALVLISFFEGFIHRETVKTTWCMWHIQRWFCFVDVTVNTRVVEQSSIGRCFQEADFELEHGHTNKNVVENKISNVQLT